MRIAPVIARLTGLGFKHIDGIAGLADVERSIKRLPAAFVAPAGETARANRLAGAHDQRIAVSFSVLIILSAAAVDRSFDDLHDKAEAVKAALSGWSHPDMAAPTDYTSGRLVAIRPGQIWWELQFSTRYHQRS